MSMSSRASRASPSLIAAVLLAGAAATPAAASLTLSPLIVDIAATDPARGDVELFNNGAERIYVTVEPSEVLSAGLPAENRVLNPDPEALGMLATPNRLVLEPGERKFLRLTLLKDPGDEDRIYRVTVKPVVGPISGGVTGLKIIVGYEMLVIQRPKVPTAPIVAVRAGDVMTFTNPGNTNAELFQGEQCSGGPDHAPIPSQRLYAKASVQVPVKATCTARYAVKVRDKIETRTFP